MILFSENKQLDDDLKQQLWDTIKPPDNKFSSSYLRNASISFLVPFYSDIISRGMNYLGLEKRSAYDWRMWYQCYNKDSDTHLLHDHYSGDELISWVHVISDANDKCFYFELGEEKVYPENQSSGNFFMFPSWAMHGVKQVETDETRLIVAGNVAFSYYKGASLSLKISKYANSKIIDIEKGGCYD